MIRIYIMSIKRIFLFVLLALVITAGGFITYFGTVDYLLFSGPTRNFNYMADGDLKNDMLIEGDIETVVRMIGTEHVSHEVLGFPIGRSETRYYYAMPLTYHIDIDRQRYCVIAVTGEDNKKALDALMKSAPVDRDPSAPRFMFKALVMDMMPATYTALTDYLHEVYDTEFNIYAHKSVKKNIVQYTLYVQSGNERGGIEPIIVGGTMILGGIALMVLLGVLIHRKNHRY